ncbi:MAG: type II toxin-antitoxin system ParD family antitoxin [Spirulina sp. SIO3F2]|nr:type II toxin-antitoxin system ParD family antitoxin [Spirulina sp. SIO3F2]
MQLTFPPHLESFVQQQLSNGKYQNRNALILAAVELLQQQEDIYQGRLQELQRDALVGWEASQRGEVVDGPTAIAQMQADLQEKFK